MCVCSLPTPKHVCLFPCSFRLYKTLGNYDVLRGIFSGHVGTKEVTKLALEAEERGDYHRAHQYYKEVRERWMAMFFSA